MKIEELCKKVVLAKLEAGYSECTAWSRYKDFYSPIISFYKSCGEDEFSLEMMVRYQEHSHDRMEPWRNRGTPLSCYHAWGETVDRIP